MSETGDFDLCIQEANAFFDVAKNLNENCTVDSLLFGTMYPIVVNATFSCELFFKAIIIHNSPTNEFERKHTLLDLYHQLSTKGQDAIRTSYESRGFLRLDELLNESNNAFVEWRYAFQHPVAAHPEEIVALAQILKDYVSKL